MLVRVRHLAVACLALLSIAAVVLCVTSYRYPFFQFIDLVGSIKRMREFEEELRTKGHAEMPMWEGPIGVIESRGGKLTVEYQGAEFTGSIPFHPRASSIPKVMTRDLNVLVLGFHYVGSSEWNGASWQCAFSLWLLSAVFGVYPATQVLKAWYRSHDRSGLCVKCGYDLSGLTERRCPECGTRFVAARTEPRPAAP